MVADAVLKRLEDSGRLLPPPEEPCADDSTTTELDDQPSTSARAMVDDPCEWSSCESMNEGESSSGGAYSCVSSPIDADISPKIKGKIIRGEYVDMIDLISNDEGNEPLNIKVAGTHFLQNTIQILPKVKKREIFSIESWTDAFLIFAAVHGEHNPSECKSLWAYARFIRKLAKFSSSKGWRDYDTQYRKQKANGVHNLAWDQVHWHLYFMCIGLSKGREREYGFQPFRSRSKPSFKGQCFAFERSGGCSYTNSRFIHSCL